MLPLLLFPMSIPSVLAMVEATTAILTGENSARFYIVLLARLRCGVYYSLSGAFIRTGSARGMKRAFPILAVVTAGLSELGSLRRFGGRLPLNRPGRRAADYLLSRAVGVDGLPAFFDQLFGLGLLPGSQ